MSDARASFSVDLADNTSGAAGAAAGSLDRLKSSIQGSKAELGQLQSAMGNLKGSSDEVRAAKSQLASQIDATKARLGEAQAAYVKAGGSLEELAAKTKPPKEGIEGIGTAAEAAGGPVGEYAGKLKKLGEISGPTLAIAAVAALTIALVAGVIALAQYAAGAANAARTQGLFLVAATGSQGAAKALAKDIDAVARSSSMQRTEIQKTAISLEEAGLKGGNLSRALRSVGTAATAMGAEAGQKIKSIAEEMGKSGKVVIDQAKLIGTGLDIGDVAGALAKNLGISVQQATKQLKDGKVKVDDGLRAIEQAVQTRFGGLAKAQMLDLGVQATKAKENLAGLFAGVKIEPFLAALQDVLSILDSNTASGKALKAILTTAMDGLFAGAAAVGPVVKKFLQGIIIVALQVGIAFFQVKNALTSAFGGDSTGGIDALAAALLAGKVAAGLIVAALVVVGVVVGSVVAGFYVLASGIQAAWGLVTSIDFGAIGAAISGAFSGVSSIPGEMMAGLVSGILGGVSGVVAAMESLGAAAIGALKSALKIASPSQVMMQFGGFTSEGFAGGLQQGTQKVAKASAAMAEEPTKAARGAMSPAKAAGAGAAAGPTPSGVTVRGATAGAGDGIHIGQLVLQGVKDVSPAEARAFAVEFVRTLRMERAGAGA